MKYLEFKELMEDKGFTVRDTDADTLVQIIDDFVVSRVSKDTIGVVDLDWLHYAGLPVETRKFIADKCMELSFTPLKDREDEQKYYYRLKGFDERRIFLKKFKHSNYIKLSTYFDVKHEQYSLTDAEFEALPEDIKAHNWEKIKVDREWSEMD